MARKVKITTGSTADALDRFERAWQRAERGRIQASEVRLTFVSLTDLLKNLTPARWALLKQLKRSGPMSISELARQLRRNYKNVHTDVSRLLELGLIERDAGGCVSVAWDSVSAEMRLSA